MEDRCYGCGKQGVIKSRCPTCNLNTSQRTDVATNHINAYTAQTRSPQLTLIDITFCGIEGRVCADTGSSHSIAGERMFQIFKDKELLFQETTLAMSLADGQQTTDVKNTCWYFWDNPTHKYPFGEELDTLSIVEKMSSNTCQLREGEGESLTSAQKEKLNFLLESFQNVFEPGGEATNILEHHINMGNSPPISVPPYRMSPVKEILRKKIEDLLEKDIIEECESLYGAPVVLIPKPNNQFRLYCPTLEQPKKKASWKWSEEEEKAFQTLKQCLVSPPILKHADFSKPFLIRTNASNYALGAVLLQGEDKEEHPVEFASRLLNPAERNYSTTEREALAVVWALNKFRGYIDGASITVASDHQPLRWLMKLKSPTGRLAHWALQLQSQHGVHPRKE
ncbi:retrovirus-related Pol polyprotein from transposon 297 [Trichonephila clavipes]|nr:retrovirus-related Pol polyprotein from transposon 297 [Trichonephila clavipes]